ncbi:MAG: rhomboid family intramembrane serine protease [Bacteroidales bacterium]
MYNKPFLDNIKNFFYSRSILSRLILVNIIIFILANLVSLYYYLFKIPPDVSICGIAVSKFTYWFAVPSHTLFLLQKPWTIFTYMFLQENFFHLLFNMIMLYFGGILFLQFLGSKKLISTYIIGGLAGATVYILAFNFFPVFNEISRCSVALGASASVLAVLVAIAVYVPEFSVRLFLFGSIKLKYIVLILVLIDILSIEKENPGGHIAHLGGALWGFTYILLMKKNRDIYSIFNPFGNFFKNLFKPKPKLKVEYKKERPLTDDEYNKAKAEKQKKIDAILDKISKNGYANLSKEEKEFLFSANNKR